MQGFRFSTFPKFQDQVHYKRGKAWCAIHQTDLEHEFFPIFSAFFRFLNKLTFSRARNLIFAGFPEVLETL